jgi:hypothetical protein
MMIMVLMKKIFSTVIFFIVIIVLLTFRQDVIHILQLLRQSMPPGRHQEQHQHILIT